MALLCFTYVFREHKNRESFEKHKKERMRGTLKRKEKRKEKKERKENSFLFEK